MSLALPRYADWQAARPILQQAAQILNVVRVADLDPLPNALRHSLQPIPIGATTGTLKSGMKLTLDYTQQVIILDRNQPHETLRLPLADHTQASLFAAVLAGIRDVGHNLAPDRSNITGTTPLKLDPSPGEIYAAVQWRMFQVLALVKAQMFGVQNPLVLWPHGYDLSTLWFAKGMDEHEDPHINVGFSPGTPDIGQPFFYVYAWPLPPGLSAEIKAPLQWHTAWSTPGAVLTYDHLVKESNPEAVAVDLLVAVYHLAVNRLQSGTF